MKNVLKAASWLGKASRAGTRLDLWIADKFKAAKAKRKARMEYQGRRRAKGKSTFQAIRAQQLIWFPA